MNKQDRRHFLKDSSRGLAGAAAAGWLSSIHAAGANERLVVGIIGPGGMGSNHIRTLLPQKDIEIAYVCDPDQERLAGAAKAVESGGRKPPQAVNDLRRVLDDRAIDAVFIATPDHWHAPATILACDAGKHVYVEKPCSHNIREGRLMLDAARRNRRVIQVGTQRRSTASVRKGMELLREGVIGEVLVAKAWNSQLRRNIGHTKPSEPPAKLDYDLWIGPAPMRPYQSNMLPGIWRWWHDFGCGDMGNDGVHHVDLAMWGLGVSSHPTTVAALGGKYFFDDDQQFPDTQYVVFEYPDAGPAAANGKRSALPGRKKQLIYEQRIWSPYHQEGEENGAAFYGTKGMMIVNNGFKIILAGDKPGESATGSADLPAHHRNFFECIKSGNTPNADVEIGVRAAALCHLGNIATRFGRTLQFDPSTEQIVNDSEAGRLVRRSYRSGHWAAPKGV